MGNKTNLKTYLVMAVLLLWFGCATAAGDVIYVDTNGSADFETIQEAINNSNNSDEIVVAEGTYIENIKFNGKNIILRSTDPNDSAVVAATIIDGNDANSVVTFSGTEDSNCVLSGFTITGGNAPEGGGIYGNGTIATIQNNIIRDNKVERIGPPGAHGDGGGLYDCDGLIQDNIIRGNDAGLGGGGGLHSCDGTITNNIISENSSLWGGGLYSCNGTIRNNLISVEDMLGIMRDKPDGVEVVFTGRRAPAEVIAEADLVTEMVGIKHYFEKGVQDRNGIEH